MLRQLANESGVQQRWQANARGTLTLVNVHLYICDKCELTSLECPDSAAADFSTSDTGQPWSEAMTLQRWSTLRTQHAGKPLTASLNSCLSRHSSAYLREVRVETVLVHSDWKVEDEQCTISAPVKLHHRHGQKSGRKPVVQASLKE
jgi:hypothetical protein